MLYRLLFSLIIIVFYNHSAFQVQALIILQFTYLVFIIRTKSQRQLRQFLINLFNESCLILMYYHLFIFGNSGIVNATDTRINIEERILFVENISISFVSLGVLIFIINFANLAISLGYEIVKAY
jgi:hypothetical protein